MSDFNPLKTLHDLSGYRDLIIELTRRELSQRVRGSYLGVVWHILTPLLTLGIYTFVFSFVFNARWQMSGKPTTSAEYALILFSGLTAFNVFSDTLSRSTTLVTNHPNYVKKVVFPLEIFPIVNLIVALILSLINIVLLIAANFLLMHSLSKTIFLLPLAYLPLIFISLAVGWFLSSLGVYIRDLTQAIPLLVTVSFFLSPIVYPITSIPETLRPLWLINPLTTITESFRQVLLWGGAIPWTPWGLWTFFSIFLALLGYWWFMGTKKGFADVL